MKKLLAVGTLVTVIGVGSLIGYADSPNAPNIVPSNRNINYTENREEWFKEKMKYKREEIQEALKNGTITQDEANTWEEHLNQMEKFHEENGFINGVCDRDNFGMGMMNKGFGNGMMGRNGRGCRR